MNSHLSVQMVVIRANGTGSTLKAYIDCTMRCFGLKLVFSRLTL